MELIKIFVASLMPLLELLFHDIIIGLDWLRQKSIAYLQKRHLAGWTLHSRQGWRLTGGLRGPVGQLLKFPRVKLLLNVESFLRTISSTNLPLWLKNSTMLMNIHYNSCNLCIKQKTFRAVKCETNINCLLLKHFPCIFEEIHFIQPKCEAHNLGFQ